MHALHVCVPLLKALDRCAIDVYKRFANKYTWFKFDDQTFSCLSETIQAKQYYSKYDPSVIFSDTLKFDANFDSLGTSEIFFVRNL